MIKQKDGAEVVFPVTDEPVITTEGDVVNVKSQKESFSAEIAKLDFFRLQYNSGLSVPDAEKSLGFSGNCVVIKGLKDSDTVRVYDAGGKVVGEYASADGAVAIDLSSLPSGCYILSAKEVNYKIVK